jgi:hypothetical protein
MAEGTRMELLVCSLFIEFSYVVVNGNVVTKILRNCNIKVLYYRHSCLTVSLVVAQLRSTNETAKPANY